MQKTNVKIHFTYLTTFRLEYENMEKKLGYSTIYN